MARAVALYREVLGLRQIEASEGIWVELEVSPTTLALHRRKDGTAG